MKLEVNKQVRLKSRDGPRDAKTDSSEHSSHPTDCLSRQVKKPELSLSPIFYLPNTNYGTFPP